MKKFIKEFKEFALKGNVMDLAIGVIIGAAFQNIVSALTNDFITPLIQAITGNEDATGFSTGGYFIINGAKFEYGDFISAVVNFLIMALILFLLIKGVNKLMSLGHKKEEEEAAPLTRKCPYCYGEIDIKATKCMHCTSDVSDSAQM